MNSTDDGYTSQSAECEAKRDYTGIRVTSNSCFQFCNDLRWFHRHFQRSRETQDLLANVASPDERKFLRKECGVKQIVVVNIMVWRRSVMKVLMICMIIATIVSVGGAKRQWQAAWAQYSKIPMKVLYLDWKKTAPAEANGFHHYSMAIFEEVQRLMMSQAAIVRAIGACAVSLLSGVSLMLCMMAGTHWLAFRYSRRKLMLAWVLSVGAPFVSSMVPARLFVNAYATREIIEAYKGELNDQLGVNDKIDMLQSQCKRLEIEGADKVQQAGEQFETICGIVEKVLPNGPFRMPTSIKFWKGFDVISVDCSPAWSGCAQGRAMIKSGKPLEGLKKAQDACLTVRKVLEQYADNYGETPEILGYFADHMQHVVEASISLQLSLSNLGTLFPAALSIAPGLLKGALRMKMLVPQSIIPGMFVLVLPWLYCPLTWCMYSLGFQLIGNPYLLVGLLLMAFNPIAYFVVGKYYRLSKPMGDEGVLVAINKIDRALMILNLVAYSLLLYFFVHIIWSYSSKQNFWGAGEKVGKIGAKIGLKTVKPQEVPHSWGARSESQLLQSVLHVDDWASFSYDLTINLVIFLASALRSFYLTSAAGVDWMIDEMVSFRSVEKAMLAQKTLGEDDILTEYNARMDQLLALDKGLRMSVFEHLSEQQLAHLRKDMHSESDHSNHV